MLAGRGKIDEPISLNEFCDPIERSASAGPLLLGVRKGCGKERSTVSERPSFSCRWEISLSAICCAKSDCTAVRWWDDLQYGK